MIRKINYKKLGVCEKMGENRSREKKEEGSEWEKTEVQREEGGVREGREEKENPQQANAVNNGCDSKWSG